MMHDQLFKDLLHAFFPDFLRLFVPELAVDIDDEPITFLDGEAFTDVPVGLRRVADVVAAIGTLTPARHRPATQQRPEHAEQLSTEEPADENPAAASGSEPRPDDDQDTVPDAEATPGRAAQTIIVHTEIQRILEAGFGYRVWEYNALIRLRDRYPVVSIAFLPFSATGGIELVRYVETIRGRDYIKLEYWQIGLRDLPADEYGSAPSVLGAALAALMQPGPDGKPAPKLALLRRVATSEIDEAHAALLVNFTQTYLVLDEVEQASYLEQRGTQEDGIVEATELTWADRMRAEGLERGIEQGLERGLLLGKREDVVRVVRGRFGTLPDAASARLDTLDRAALDRVLDLAVKASTLDEVIAAL